MIGTIEQMMTDMQNGVFDKTDNGECTNCGECCTDFLPVTKAEIRTIKQYVAKHRVKEQKHFLPTAKPLMDFTCPFRDNKGRRCVIYEARPLICRDFKCDKSAKGEQADPELYAKTREIVSMRQTFYGRAEE